MKTQNKEKTVLKATPRTEFGKKLRKLRHHNIIPANVFGRDFKSQAISLDVKDFYRAFKIAHETGVVYVDVDGKEIPTMIKSVQLHPVSDSILHVDFRKIDLKKKVETEVPIEIVGESPAVKEGGVLLTQANHLMVEALPNDVPKSIEIDASTITEIGTDIKVQDIKKSANYEIKEDPERTVISVVEHKEESVEPETAQQQPEVEGEEAGEEGATEEGGEKAPAEEVKEEASE